MGAQTKPLFIGALEQASGRPSNNLWALWSPVPSAEVGKTQSQL